MLAQPDYEYSVKIEHARQKARINEDVYSARTKDGQRYYADLRTHNEDDITTNPKFQPEISEWPLSASDFMQVERQLLQRPEWLAYWARFGWTSWQHVTAHWWFDKTHNRFVFYDVPKLWYHNNISSPDRGMLVLSLTGEVIERTSEYAHLSAVLPSCVKLCQEKVREISPKLKWLRSSYYIRFGMWPKNERSQNFLNTEEVVFEDGVSAYHASYEFDEDRWAIDPSVNEAAVAGTMQSLIYGNRPIFLVQGTELSKDGADGEPLIRDVKLIKQLSKNDVYCPGFFDPREDE